MKIYNISSNTGWYLPCLSSLALIFISTSSSRLLCRPTAFFLLQPWALAKKKEKKKPSDGRGISVYSTRYIHIHCLRKLFQYFGRQRYIYTVNFEPQITDRNWTETGRWNGIDREDRQCLKCNSRSIGDEFHYIMECHFFTENRTHLIK